MLSVYDLPGCSAAGSVRGGVDAAVVVGLAHPGKVGALGFACYLGGRLSRGVGGVVGAGQRVAAEDAGLGEVERVRRQHLLVVAGFAAQVVAHAAVVEVHEQDAVGERQHLHNVGGVGGAGQQQGG